MVRTQGRASSAKNVASAPRTASYKKRKTSSSQELPEAAVALDLVVVASSLADAAIPPEIEEVAPDVTKSIATCPL